MKCNPFVSMPLALGLFAIAASQVFSTVGMLAADPGPDAIRQSVEVLEAQDLPGPARRFERAVGRSLAVQQLRIVDSAGNPVIVLSGTPDGARIDMRTPEGDRVMSMGAHSTGAFRQRVLSEGETVAAFLSQPNGGTHLRFSSPGRHATIAADLWTRASTLTAFSTTRMDGRAALYQWLSLSGATVDGQEFLPGHMATSATNIQTREVFPFAEHQLFSLDELEAAMSRVLPADE